MLASGERLTRNGDVGYATRVRHYVQAVLGLSMTSTSVGWVLLDGQGPDAAVLDNDAFDFQSADGGAEGDTSPHIAAARGAQTIATASGHKVDTVHVTWTDDVEADAVTLLKSLVDLGFDNVHSISLSKAAQAWGIEVGQQSEHAKTGLCILEPHLATVMIVATGAGTVRTAVTDTRESPEDLVEWLRTVFRKDGWLPESLYLIGAHSDLDEVTQPIADALPIAVTDSVETQIALARGAALATVSQGETAPPQTVEPTWRVSLTKKTAAAAPATTQLAATAIDTAVTQEIAKPRKQPKAGSSTRQRPWLLAHAKKLTIGAAAVAVFGAALSLAAGSALNVENSSAQAADPAPEGASVTSVSIHTVPPQPVPELQPMAAEPPPAPPPPPPLEPLPPPAEPVASVAPEPVAVPVPEPVVTVVPHAVPAAAPVAPLAAPVPPPAAAPAPVAPPPAAPAPIASPPPPAEGAEPPPADPIQQVLSPLFSGLP
ncbi:hypothetical protein GGC64_002206 [Mycobacterium sp. OAS707]|uniref:DUF7159 family protein n=1 Tax=Mycobacterium sp. OAS707 TaxID=2663822 RepID=UPI00178C0D70|nr:hypothetical protein [Mycobacterium sp. OAS707]MBE1548182.1 hypothetical protein [Mycobacterium sp. OAS707]